jgi:hypothetical protein
VMAFEGSAVSTEVLLSMKVAFNLF